MLQRTRDRASNAGSGDKSQGSRKQPQERDKWNSFVSPDCSSDVPLPGFRTSFPEVPPVPQFPFLTSTSKELERDPRFLLSSNAALRRLTLRAIARGRGSHDAPSVRVLSAICMPLRILRGVAIGRLCHESKTRRPVT